MGTSKWSNEFYESRATDRKARGLDLYAYHTSTSSQAQSERKVHAQMNPYGVTRESRDSDEHPESIAIGVILDQTGSMKDTPREIQKVLPKLMTALVAGGVKDPQVLFGAVGDTTNHEVASCQIGQFESGLEMEDDLGRMYMEGCGGGSYEESYQNVIYFFARHTSIDCLEKRGRKGYLFIVGDEHAYDEVSREEALQLFGDTLQANIPLASIVKECQEQYDIFFVIPTNTNHGRDHALRVYWEKLLGADRVLLVRDTSVICDAIVSAVQGQPGNNLEDERNVRL